MACTTPAVWYVASSSLLYLIGKRLICMIWVGFPPLSPGGHARYNCTLQVAKLLQHPDGAPGAATTHDLQGEHEASAAARRPDLHQLKTPLHSSAFVTLLLFFCTMKHSLANNTQQTHIYTHSNWPRRDMQRYLHIQCIKQSWMFLQTLAPPLPIILSSLWTGHIEARYVLCSFKYCTCC